MPSQASVTLDDLEDALMWVSSGESFQSAAFISKATGQVFYSSTEIDVEEELPEDMNDPALYWCVPHKSDLELGRDLVFQFAREHLPEQMDLVRDCFHRRGAYARYKDLLDRTGKLERWHQYEQEATRAALLAWADEEGINVIDRAGPIGT